MAQYKLEGPGGTPAAWLPEDGFSTKTLEWKIDQLPPAAQIRVRIRAIGDEIGPWSDEVLGKAR